MMTSKVLLSSVLVLVPTLSWAADATSLADLAAISGSTVGQVAGTAVINIGDVNGDGYEDLAVSAPYAGNDEEGAVYIVYGRADRIDGIQFEDLPKFTGEDDGDKLGQQIGSLGDIDADGYDDFAVVSNYHDGAEVNPGAVYIIYGQAAEYSNQTVATRPRFYGEERADGAGAVVHTAGDLDNDGFDDFAVSASLHDNYSGGVYLIYGQAGRFSGSEELGDYTFFAGAAFDHAASALEAVDVTRDCISDLIVAASDHDDGDDYDVGVVYIIPGGSRYHYNLPLDDFPYILGTTEDEKVASRLAVGDLNGDGYVDIVIGAQNSDEDGEGTGRVYIMLGAASLPTTQTIADAIVLTTNTAGDLFGIGLAVASDLNGDGYDDLLSGAPSEYDPEAGRAFVSLGNATLQDHNVEEDYPFLGEEIGSRAGQAVTTADLNGDGVDEIVIAAKNYGSDGGKVYIGYWPIYNCANSAELGGILADYPDEDYKLRRYAANDHYKIAVERHGRQAFVLNCINNTVVQTLTFNERVQRKILARVFDARSTDLFIVVTRTPSKRRIKVFLYQVTETELVETDYFRRKWRPRGFRIKLGHKNQVVLQRGQEKKHRLKYQVTQSLELTELN